MTTPVPSHDTWDFDNFFEPRTIPGHWDLSDLMTPAKPSGNGHVKRSAPSCQACEPGDQAAPSPVGTDKIEEPPLEWRRNPFPKPKTLPAHWDLSK